MHIYCVFVFFLTTFPLKVFEGYVLFIFLVFYRVFLEFFGGLFVCLNLCLYVFVVACFRTASCVFIVDNIS